jgi:radical SAM superfamily enzyme YgiQ (UPF0313 family)
MDEFFGYGLMHLASRGCPYSCNFCSVPAIRKTNPGKYYRLRSSTDVIEEIKINQRKYKKRGLKNIVMVDATFGIDEGQLDSFCNLFAEEGLNRRFTWTCQTRADIVTSNWAKTASMAGCAMVALGIESGDERIRMLVYNKNIKQEQIENAVKYLRENNILYQFNLIVGCPGETTETINKSLELIKKTEPISAYFTPYQPLPKTDLASRVGKSVFGEKNAFNLNKVMWSIRRRLIYEFIRQGFKMKGPNFILDIIKFIFSSGNLRTLPLKSPYLRIELAQKTIYKYAMEEFGKKTQARNSYE